MIGASGAVSGVLGAYLILFPQSRVLTLVIFGFFWRLVSTPAVVVLGFWIVLQVLNGLGSLGRRERGLVRPHRGLLCGHAPARRHAATDARPPVNVSADANLLLFFMIVTSQVVPALGRGPKEPA